jgi:hypothetical protein
MKLFIIAALAAAITAGGLVAAAPQASAGCQNPGWPDHPMAEMCDNPMLSDGMWERCVTDFPGGTLQAQTNCYIMEAGQPPAGNPELGIPPNHIDP